MKKKPETGREWKLSTLHETAVACANVWGNMARSKIDPFILVDSIEETFTVLLRSEQKRREERHKHELATERAEERERFYQKAQKEANKYMQDTLFPQLKVAITEILLSTNDALKLQ